MGFEVTRFPDQPVSTHLLCFLCNKVLQEPLQTGDCEHSFCAFCIRQWLKSATICPHYGHDDDNISVKSESKKKSPLRKMSFRKIIGKSSKETSKDVKLPQLRLEDLKQLPASVLDELNALRIRCEYADNGCDAVLHIADLSAHLTECAHAIASVSKDGTDKSVNEDSVSEAVPRVSGDDDESCESTNDQQSTKDTISVPDADGSECTGSEAGKSSRKGSCISEDREEVGSDDFVVVPKNEPITSSESGAVGGDRTSDKASTDPDNKSNEKKKKKKKKKKVAKKDDDTSSQKDESASNSGEEDRKSSMANTNMSSGGATDGELIKRLDALQLRVNELESEKQRDDQKFEHLRTVNVQLVAQIKQLQLLQKEQQSPVPASASEEQKEAQQKQLQDLQQQLTVLQDQTRRQEQRIEALSAVNANYHKLIVAMREQEVQAKDRFVNTIDQFSRVLQTIRAVRA